MHTIKWTKRRKTELFEEIREALNEYDAKFKKKLERQ